MFKDRILFPTDRRIQPICVRLAEIGLKFQVAVGNAMIILNGMLKS